MYHFKLQPVLSLKENLEGMKKRELGNAQQLLNRLVAEEEILLQRKNATILAMQKESQGQINPSRMCQYGPYLQQIDRVIEEKQTEVIQARKVLEEKRTALQEAWKEKKILENLKEMHKKVYLEEENKKEQQIIDEIVSYKYLIDPEGE